MPTAAAFAVSGSGTWPKTIRTGSATAVLLDGIGLLLNGSRDPYEYLAEL